MHGEFAVMMPSFASDLGIIALIWLMCWGASFWLIRRGLTYISNPVVTSVLFFSFSVPIFVLHRARLAPLIQSATGTSLAALALAVFLTLSIYSLASKRLPRPDELIRRHPEEFYLRLDYRYLLPKSFEVLFQQLCIGALATSLAVTGLPVVGVVLAFVAIFGLLHLPMLGIVGRRVGLGYSLASLTLAAVFPLLILHVPAGFVYSYTAHWFSYTLVALVAWVRSARGSGATA